MQAIDDFRKLAESLVGAGRVCVLTGAGVSKESGVPTFREADGLWSRFRPEELANVEAFISNPERVWEWYSWRRELMAGVQPNPGHYALAELEELLGHFVLITQNVDNLHQNAGSRDVIELHGNIQRNRCHSCHRFYPEGTVKFAKGELPRCECGGLIRPDVVWFGEMLPPEAIDRASREAQRCDVFLSIGTSAVVYPAAALPHQAKAAGARLVEINPAPTELSPLADLVFRMPSGEAMPRIVEEVKALLEERG
ncbi:MAG TPA: NAD-dependent deacylase [Bacteroidetes bacterium]|nr:NAD-dependent deacylase [Bacteroidota bacterium]